MIDEAYDGREQAYVKHYVLRHYLERLAYKIGNFQRGTTLNYIDGFAGPWDATTDDARDSSPSIAIEVLGRVVEKLAPKRLSGRAMFVESNSASFHRLQKICDQTTRVEAIPVFGEFESLIKEAIAFASHGRPSNFPFVFIDPTGWTGYGMEAITPLLQLRPSEVLLNFMTKDVIRFIDDPTSSALATFVDLFGDASYRDEWVGLKGLDREDAIVILPRLGGHLRRG